MTPLLQMRGIERRFGAVRANDGIDLDVPAGQIVGLLGENGSGKTTLMNVLFGMLRPDAGAVVFRGRELSGHGPSQAMAAGLAMIHQHFKLIEAMTVVENVMLGWTVAGQVLRRAAMAQRVRDASQRFGLDLDPQARIGDLPLGRRQQVEILKAILRDAELLIMDEPTSNLAPPEVAGLFAILRRLRTEGRGVILITHKLGEALEVCDEVVVLRAGRVVGRTAASGTSRGQLAEMMVGNAVERVETRRAATPGAGRLGGVRLAVARLRAAGLGGIDLALHGGEIVGVAGVDGNGQFELAQTLAGLHPAVAGTIRLEGRDVTRAGVAARTRAGLAYMPADRSDVSLVPAMTVAENLMLRDARRPPYSRRGLLSHAGREAKARALIAAYDIRTPGPATPVARLSGGNQQKIVVARELDRAPTVLIAHQPTWGLDPDATRSVLGRMLALRDAGAAVLAISSELEELLAISDRIAVMAAGKFIGVTSRADADLRQIGLWMAGHAA